MNEKPKKLTLVVMSKTTIVVLIAALILGVVGVELYLRNTKRAEFETKVNGELNFVRAELLDLRTQSSDLQKKSTTCSFSLNLNPRVGALESTLTNLAGAIDSSSKRIDALYKQVGKLADSFDGKIETLNRQVADIAIEVKVTKERLAQLEKNIDSLVGVVEEVNKRSLDNQKQIGVLKSQVGELTVQVEDLQRKLDKEITRIDSENRLIHYNYDAVLKAQKLAAGTKTE